MEATRSGYGGVAFNNGGTVGCIADLDDLIGHDESLAAAEAAVLFERAIAVEGQVQVSASEAFMRAQRGRCAYIYGNAATLKLVIDASVKAKVEFAVLPFWKADSEIAARRSEIRAQARSKEAAEGDRQAALRKAADEAKALERTQAQQKETRQRELRAQHGAKVASLVGTIGQQITEVRKTIDEALRTRRGLRKAVTGSSFWAPFPSWYAKRRASGWLTENMIATPRDYGIALWKGRRLEAVFADVKIVMKNADFGEYGESCWLVGYIDDSEFGRYREPLVVNCADQGAFFSWGTKHRFDSRWDLGTR
jgi:hypothetical protein